VIGANLYPELWHDSAAVHSKHGDSVSFKVRKLSWHDGEIILKSIFKTKAAVGRGLDSFGTLMHCGGTWYSVLVS